MGTRGFITFVIDGTEKTTYNHWDSYPDALGLDVLHFLTAHRHELTCDLHRGQSGKVVEQARSLRVVNRDDTPTAEDVERLGKFSWNKDQHGGDRDLRQGQEWYDLLHETQGNLPLILEAGVIEDASAFPQDSLFAEFGYVIDLDAQRFEVYEGFQTSHHDKGRFAGRKALGGGNSVGTYYPVALRASWPLAELPDDAAFAAATTDAEDDE